MAPTSYGFARSTHLLFVQGGTLVAQPFDGARSLMGDPVPIAENVDRGTFSISRNGVLAYRAVAETQFVWFDRAGTSLGPAGPTGGYLQFSVSPRTARVAATRLDPQLGTSDIWIIDGTAEQRLTFDASWENSPLWSRDESRIVFNSNRTGRWEIYEKASSGNSPERRVLSSETSAFATDWSSDGRVLFQQSNRQIAGRFWLVTPNDDPKPVRLPVLDSDENDGRISPDGRWLAYTGYQAGTSVVYVRPLLSTESRWQVSPAGGTAPRWRADGRELYYLSPDLSVMAMDIEPGPTFRAGPARRLFQTRAVAPSGLNGVQVYDVAPDGRRFLVKVPASFSPLTVVVNWTSLFGGRRR